MGKVEFLTTIGIALGIGVARHIKPMPCPAFAIVGRRQKFFDKAHGESALCFFGSEKSLQLLELRGQPGQVVIKAPNPVMASSGRHRRQSCPLKAISDNPSDRVSGCSLGEDGTFHRAKSPVSFPCPQVRTEDCEDSSHENRSHPALLRIFFWREGFEAAFGPERGGAGGRGERIELR